MFDDIKALLFGVKRFERPLFSVPFSYKKPQQTSLFGTYAYLFAQSQREAITAIKSKIHSQGWEYVEIIGDIRIIPIAEWTHHVNNEWPTFKDVLPSKEELDAVSNKNEIFLLPSIEQKN